MIAEIKKMAETEKVEWKEDEYQRSEKYIKLQIKALIARNVWEMQQYYEVTLKEDPTITKAIQVLKSNKQYKQLLQKNWYCLSFFIFKKKQGDLFKNKLYLWTRFLNILFGCQISIVKIFNKLK